MTDPAPIEATNRELAELEVPLLGVSGLAGRFNDDPTLFDICEQIYIEREAELAQ